MELYNATVDLLERNLSGSGAGRTYLRTRERDFSYAEVSARADAAGAGLLELGLVTGDRVLIACDDCMPLVAMFWGAMKAGCVPVPVPPVLTAAGIAVIARDSGARAVLFDHAAERAVAGLPLPLIAVDETRLDARPFDSLRGRLPPPTTAASDVAFGLYTSGTTGEPKGVWHRHRSLRAVPAGLATQVLQLGPDDVVLSVSPMYFAYGLGNSVYLPAAFGATVIVRDFIATPGAIVDLMAAQRPTLLCSVPSFYRSLLAQPGGALPSLRRAISAGEALPASTYERFAARFGIPLLDELGCTEAMHAMTSNFADDHRPDSAGRPLDGFEAEVRGGELWVRGPTIENGWLRTGDLAEIIDGRVRHIGRVDDLFKLAGMWIAPREIEDVLRAQPGVDDAAVVLLDDERHGPRLKAFVQGPRGEQDVRALQAACQAKLPAFKVPRVFETVEELPRTPTGKVRRVILRRQS